MSYTIANRRYVGCKAKLADWIMSLIHKECHGKVFADIFAGTGVMAATASASFESVIVNDLLYSNYASYKAFFEKGSWKKDKIIKIIENYNSIDPKALKENYFSNNFGGSYFSKEVARTVGFIREDIERRKPKLTEKEYYVLLVSLLYAIDKIANTVGHYDAFFRKPPKNSKFIMKLIDPLNIENVHIYREDANALAKKVKADVAYIDPPYNSRQYSRFYHVLETLTKWDKPELYGVALKPKPENMSDYCRNGASEKFADLIENLDCRYIAVSYNNTYNSKSSSSRNKITLERIEEILNERGTTKTFEKPYRFFTSGKTSFDDHKEMLFITKVAD